MTGLAKAFAAIALAAATGSPGARADILAFGSYENVIGVTATEQAIPLRQNGSTTLTFRTTEPNTFVAVTYNAVCYVQSHSIYGGLGTVRVRITIDGVEPKPQPWSSTNNLCTAENTRTGYAAQSRQVGMRVREAGRHTVQVFAIRDEPAYNGALYTSSILVQD
jgi:hypothetical protein